MQTAEEVVVVRCPSCGGLRGVSARHVTRYKPVCPDCRHGEVILRERYYEFWLERFTMEEICEMAKAIWG